MEPPRPASTKSPWSGIGALEVQELGDEGEEAGGAGLEGRHRPFQFTCCRFTLFLLVLCLYGVVSAYKSTIFFYYIRSLVACDEVMHPQCTAVRKMGDCRGTAKMRFPLTCTTPAMNATTGEPLMHQLIIVRGLETRSSLLRSPSAPPRSPTRSPFPSLRSTSTPSPCPLFLSFSRSPPSPSLLLHLSLLHLPSYSYCAPPSGPSNRSSSLTTPRGAPRPP